MAINLKPYLNPLLHVLGWAMLGFLLLFYVPLSWNVTVPQVFWTWQSLVLIIMLILFYVNAKIIVPQTYIKGKPGLFVLWLSATVAVTQLIAFVYASYTNMHVRMALLLGKKTCVTYWFDKFIFTITLLVLAISTSLAVLQHWQRAVQYKKELEKDKMAAELAMLKTQIHPHFFFNSLNSIFSLTYIDAEDARKALLTLGRMMRYLLYSTEDGNTTLAKEVEFLKDYISLMRLRASDKVQVTTDIQEELNDYPIASMLLLPFVENAFKHGVDSIADTEINIALKQDGPLLEFDVMNCAFPKGHKSSDEGGVGLANTQRRLQLLYPHRYKLYAGLASDGKYKVNLQINLVS